MVRKFQILKGKLGRSLEFWMEPSPGVWGGTGLGWGCVLVGFPGLGGPTFSEERTEVAMLGWKGS